LSGAIGAGILATWGPTLPAILVAGIGGISGIIIGLDSFPAEAPPSDTAMALAGLSAGFMTLIVLLTGLSLAAEKGWRRIVLQIVGSWIAAISLLALSLELAGGFKATS
jgi:hypothetical protein